jgi:L-ascorbate metabolism protein UlaG (beta-lactamase superfamily)
MRIQLVRHATLVIEISDKRIVVDPMLGAKGTMPPIQNAPNPVPIPLVDLPAPVASVLRDAGAVLITHTHRDHWDEAAAAQIRKYLPILCQPEDVSTFQVQGFTDVRAIESSIFWQKIEIHRTGGEHGTGEISKAMAPVSGYIVRPLDKNEPTLYIAGDTIWCAAVSDALARYRPQVIVLNAGAAQFLEGGPITMTADDVVDVCQAAPEATVIAVHMEAVNHCLLTRAALREHLREIHVNPQVVIPADGEWITV